MVHLARPKIVVSFKAGSNRARLCCLSGFARSPSFCQWRIILSPCPGVAPQPPPQYRPCTAPRLAQWWQRALKMIPRSCQYLSARVLIAGRVSHQRPPFRGQRMILSKNWYFRRKTDDFQSKRMISRNKRSITADESPNLEGCYSGRGGQYDERGGAPRASDWGEDFLICESYKWQLLSLDANSSFWT